MLNDKILELIWRVLDGVQESPESVLAPYTITDTGVQSANELRTLIDRRKRACRC